jgi:hypothetical protein
MPVIYKAVKFFGRFGGFRSENRHLDPEVVLKIRWNF